MLRPVVVRSAYFHDSEEVSSSEAAAGLWDCAPGMGDK